jgi:hypothetical protein
VRTAVAQFLRRFGGELPLQLLQPTNFVLAWTISWLGFGLSDQLLLMRYPWGKVRYPLFGYLA